MRALLTIVGVVLLVTGCTSDSGDDKPQAEGRTSPSRAIATQSESALNEVVRLDHVPSARRPDCPGDRVRQLVVAHLGWPSLERAAAGLLRHPGADHAALTPVKNGHAIVLLYRGDDSRKAKIPVRHVQDKWFPDYYAVCRADMR